MSGALRILFLSGTLLLLGAPAALAQVPDWRPPSRQMPPMPTADQVGGWISAHGDWFRGVDGISGTPAARLVGAGEAPGGRGTLRVARFMDGPIPVVVWSDRNADGRADLVEIFRRGGVIVQLIDADYDGAANVLRIYDASGALIREERM